MTAREFFDAVDRYIFAQDEFAVNKSENNLEEVRKSAKIVRDEVVRVRAILKGQMQEKVPSVDLDRIL